MTPERFWQAVAIARANNEGKLSHRSVTQDHNLVCEALVWMTLPPAIPEKRLPLASSNAETRIKP